MRYSSAEKKACRTNTRCSTLLTVGYHLVAERNAKRKRVEGENGVDLGSSQLNPPPGPDSSTQNEAETLRAFALSVMEQEGDATATRASIRAANLKAAAALKGNLMADTLPSDPAPVVPVGVSAEVSTMSMVESSTSNDDEEADMDVEDDEAPAPPVADLGEPARIPAEADLSMEVNERENGGKDVATPRGLKRKRDEMEDEESLSDDAAEESGNPLALKVNADGSVEQVDSVRYVGYVVCLYTMLTSQ